MKDGKNLYCDLCAEFIAPITGLAGRPRRFCTDCVRTWRRLTLRVYLAKRGPRRRKREADARYTASGKRNITRKATELAKLTKEKDYVANRKRQR